MNRIFDKILDKLFGLAFIFFLICIGYKLILGLANNSLPTNSQQTITNNSTFPKALPNNNPNHLAKTPRKLEPGSIIKIYKNIDNNLYPNPANYSPIEAIKTNNLTLTNLDENSPLFQEASGYFLVKNLGYYRFILNLPLAWSDKSLALNLLSVKIDDSILESANGGDIYLDKGWHKISIFSQYKQDLGAEIISINWGKTNQSLKPLKIWREI
ncbi:MAG: hypothetical protein QNJ34_11075 [Xenococcaceae cyanobacterium MO_188.B29]|nr:hypothetical protein [Xenococcaceae cyanobacterium MO_188.B29]